MLIFGQTYMEFNYCHDNVKNDGRRIFILKFPRRMKGQLLKVFRVNFLFKPLFVRPRVNAHLQLGKETRLQRSVLELKQNPHGLFTC